MVKSFIAVVVVAVVVAALAILTKVGQAPERQQQQQQKTTSVAPKTQLQKVILSAKGFEPATITIKAGESISWSNNSGKEATVNSDPHPTHNFHAFLNLGTFASGSSVQAKFEDSGTYHYHNHLNPSQKGIIVVK